jgi:hypothetical protein
MTLSPLKRWTFSWFMKSGFYWIHPLLWLSHFFSLMDCEVVGFFLGPNVLFVLYIESRGGLVWVCIQCSSWLRYATTMLTVKVKMWWPPALVVAKYRRGAPAMPAPIGVCVVRCGVASVHASQGWQRRRRPDVNSLFDCSSRLWLVFQPFETMI